MQKHMHGLLITVSQKMMYIYIYTLICNGSVLSSSTHMGGSINGGTPKSSILI